MKRTIGTALSVIGLLAVGTAAAAINVRVLHTSDADRAHIVMRTSGDMTVMKAVPHTVTAPASQPASPSASASADAQGQGGAATASPVPSDHPTPPMGQPVPGPDGHWSGGHARMLPPNLTPDQLNLLRIGAMAHVRPDVVLQAAKDPTSVDASTLQQLRAIADYLGVDLASLADVTDVPKLMDRGHGGPDMHGDRNSDY